MKYSQSQLEEIKRCKSDFWHFVKYLKIILKSGRVIPFKPNSSQKKIFDAIFASNYVYILKSRQIGNTTAIAAFLFWKALFNQNFRIGVLAHKTLAANNIFKMYGTFYKHLPSFLRFTITTENTSQLVFKHGSSIHASSAGSDFLQGGTLNALHCSEFAEYTNHEETIASIFPSVDKEAGIIILETTANGLNAAYKIWIDASSQYLKLFIPWTQHEEYAHGRIRRLFAKQELTDWERKYQQAYNLSDAQISWVKETINTECAGNINLFNQGWPITAEVAFITSGTKYFSTIFTGADVVEAKSRTGLQTYSQPAEFSRCLMGVDVATGQPNGDYHAISIIDYSNRDKMKVVATYRSRSEIHEFADTVLSLAMQYRALVTVERNMGIPILEHLKMNNYPWLYRKVVFAKSLNQWTETLGFSTTQSTRPYMLSRLQEYVSLNKLDIVCPATKNEMNSFIYKENTSHPEAATGAHDDMVFATALALMGLDQATSYEEAVFQMQRPRTNEQVILWELKNKTTYNSVRDDEFWDDSDWIDHQQEISLSDLR